ncbi:MAG: biotin synthase BioB [Elusimicrobiota bacterium]
MLSTYLINLTEKVFAGEEVDLAHAEKLIAWEDNYLEDLFYCAYRIRRQFHTNQINFCSIINAKSGACHEDCKFCAQSILYNTKISRYPLVSTEEIVNSARLAKEQGAHGFSIVTSGASVSGDKELSVICQAVEGIKGLGLYPCASLGELNQNTAQKLKEAGLVKYHHNLETSAKFFPKICTTHTYENKIKTLRLAKELGFQVCSGGIFGLGETNLDRLELAFTLRQLDVDSIPLNFLNPMQGTPLEKNKPLSPREILKIIAVYRFIFPKKKIVICGGREKNLRDLQSWMYYAGANAAMLGNYLTTTGRPPEEDLRMINDLNLKASAPAD